MSSIRRCHVRLSLTDAKNHVTTYTYDNMDRAATRKDALNRTESYQYL